ncbi:MAG: gliding motility-associated C-terminal domain-containing protein [Fluviicola sp.]
MNNKFYLLIFALFCSTLGFSQFPGCPDVNAGADQVLPCSQNCTNLTATPFHTGAPTSYAVSSITHAPPIAYNAAGGTAVSVGTDDVWSPPITLPFNFCFYGVNYTTINVGSNGAIQFGGGTAGGSFHPWSYTASCPNPALSTAGDVFGVYHDIDPSVAGSVRWYILGTAPCRIFVVSFNNLGHFSCTSLRTTSMMVLYETTNVIDVYVNNKATCTSWNGGRAIIGIQNPAGTAGIAAPGRNAGANWTVTTPEAWRFTPNGVPNYTIAWFQGATQIGTGATINVCPGGPATYTARVTYTMCNGTTVVETDQVNVSYGTLPAPTVTPVAETCANLNNGSVTINNVAGAGPYTVAITGPSSSSSSSVVEPNTAGGVANFTNLPDGAYNYTVTGNNGCTTSGSFTITPGGICCSVTASSTPALCNGGTSGTAISNPVGVAPFNYSWTGGQTTQTATNLAAGAYTITLTDATGCVATANATITQPTLLTLTTAQTNVTCNGGCNGSITLTAGAGTPGYTYSINGATYQASNTFTGLCAGAYTVYVRDANNCIRTANVTITQPAVLTLTLGAVTPATCGNNNGSITVSASGGTTAYSYSIGGPGQASGTFTGLAPGPRTITVTDANGCTQTVNATIVAQNAPLASIISAQNITCNGGINGSVLIGASGGTGAYTYSLNNNVTTQLSNSFGFLTAGSYTATVTDANLCTSQVTFNITQPSPVAFTNVPTNVSCNGLCNGQIVVTPSGGTAPYEFSSNAGNTFQPSSTLGGLCAGIYDVVVRDQNGCLINQNINITQPTPLSATFVNTNPICHDQCDGIIAITPSGGTGPYTYSLNGGAFSPANPINNACGTANAIIVRDANNCEFTSTQTLINPPAHDVTVIILVESNCGFNNGSIEVNTTSPNAPYQYQLNGGPLQSIGFFGGLFGGAYLISVVDALGCVTDEFMGINDVEMDGILLTSTNSTCFGASDGTVSVTNVSGAAPITYQMDTLPTLQLTGNFAGLAEGTHIVTIFDAGLCVFTLPFMITEPDSITFQPTPTDPLCFGGTNGSITVSNVNGGTGPYMYSINGGAFQLSPTFNGLAAGTYTIAVQDASLCSNSTSVIVTQPTQVIASANSYPLTCNGNNSGYIVASASGGGGTYQYNINGGPFSALNFFSSLAAGTYTIGVQDQFTCPSLIIMNVTQPPILASTFANTPATCNSVCDGSITFNASGGTLPYLYSADNGLTFNTTNVISNLCAGNHNLIVMDSNNCSITGLQTIAEPAALVVNTVLTASTCDLNNAEIQASAIGGILPFTFSIDNNTTTNLTGTFTGLNDQSYTVLVTDDNLCQTSTTVTLTNQASPVITGTSLTNILCNAACTGEIVVNSTGGTAPIQYSIGGPNQAGTTFSSICAGTYLITVTDGNTCQDTLTVTLTEPANLTFTSTPTNLDCFQDNSGEITFNANGGVPLYTYSVDNGLTFGSTSTVSNLAAGTYQLIVQDANNCTEPGTVIITEPTQLTIPTQNQTNVLCNGDCDGTATITPAGGTLPYTFAWINSTSLTNTAINLCAGSYNVEVTDFNGCVESVDFNITEPPLLEITSITATDALCNGSCDGTITITSPLATQFSVDGINFQASNVFNGLCAGTYTATAQDANGCSESQQIIIDQPTQLTQLSIPEDGMFICYNGFGTLSAEAQGGTPPYTYTWSAGDTAQYLNVNLTAPATFTVNVLDVNGCTTASVSATVNVHPEYIPSVTNNLSACPGNSVNIVGSGVGGVIPYDYQWLTTSFDTLASGNSTFNYIPQGQDTLLLVSWDACYAYDTLEVYVNEFVVPNPVISANPAQGCSPFDATFTLQGSTANIGSVDWTFGDGGTLTTVGASATHQYIPVGCYDVSVEITTNDGCVADSTFNNFACVVPDPVANFTFSPNAPTVVNSLIQFNNTSTNAVSYDWDFGSFGSSIVENPSVNFGNIEPGGQQVCLEVTSPEGCINEICQTITFGEEFLLFVPNTFTPDGDEHNNVFKPVKPEGIVLTDYNLTIFDRWGEVIFESNNFDIGWDGTYRDHIVKEGTYVWRITVKLNDNSKNKIYTGHVTMLK